MPDIAPAQGDLVEVHLASIGVVIAKIGTKNPDGTYLIFLEGEKGEPTMNGCIAIPKYGWSHDLGRWLKKPPPPPEAAPAPPAPRVAFPAEAPAEAAAA